MVHSIELTFDAATEAALRRIWGELAAAGIPSQAPAARPHVTLVVAEAIAADVDAVLAPIASRLPLDCAVGAPLLLGRSHAVLARLMVPSAGLLSVHAEAHRLAHAHLGSAPMPTSLPGQWTPHVTLARRLSPARLERALRIAGRPPQITGRFAGLRRWDGGRKTEYPIG